MESVKDPNQFITIDLLLLDKLWGSDVEVIRLRADPHRYAIDAGPPVNPGAQARVDESAMDEL